MKFRPTRWPIRPKSQVGPDGPFGLANMCRETRKNDLVLPSGLGSTKCEILSAVEVTLHECLELAVVSGDVVAHRAIVEGAEFLEDTVDHFR